MYLFGRLESSDAVTIAIGDGSKEVHALGVGLPMSRIVLWQHDREAVVRRISQRKQFSVVGAALCIVRFYNGCIKQIYFSKVFYRLGVLRAWVLPAIMLMSCVMICPYCIAFKVHFGSSMG